MMTFIKILAVIVLAFVMALMITGVRYLLDQPLLGPLS